VQKYIGEGKLTEKVPLYFKELILINANPNIDPKQPITNSINFSMK